MELLGREDLHRLDAASHLDLAERSQARLAAGEPGGLGAHQDFGVELGLIAFQADQESGLVVMRPDGTDRKLLTWVSDTGFGISWSPDSMRIAFVSFGTDSVIGADGSGEAEVLDIADSVIEDVAWRP